MAAIDLITSIYVTCAEESLTARAEQLRLVCTGVSTEERILAQIVSIRRPAADMVWGNQKIVKALLRSDDRVEAVPATEGWVPASEVSFNFALDYVQGVIYLQVQITTRQTLNIRCYIVAWVVGDIF